MLADGMTLLRRVRIVGERDSQELSDVLIVGARVGLIAAAGSLAVDGAEIIDLDGRYLVPGLWDYHVHMNQWALSRRRVDLSGATSAAEVVGRIAQRVPATASAEILIGYGFRDGLWPDAPDRRLLDAVAPAAPVVLFSNDLHCCWLNSAALALVGQSDHATGLLRELELLPVLERVQQTPADLMDEWVGAAVQSVAARGVVGIVDLERAPNVDSWTRRAAAGSQQVRVVCGVYAEHLDQAIERGLRTGDVLPGTDGLVTMGPLKVITDGSLNTRTAYCHDPYPGLDATSEQYGLLVVPPEELAPLMKRAGAHGIESAIHAIGDRAVGLALDAFEQVGARGSLEHAQLVSSGDFARFAANDVVASVQPRHAIDDRAVADRHWAGRTDRAFPYRRLLDSGATLALGSDAPVAPLDPWITMAAATRRTADDQPSWHPEQELPRAASLAASTLGRTHVHAGTVADLVVTELDPMTCTITELAEMPVAATMLDGKWTYRTEN